MTAAKKPDTRIINRGRGHSYLLDGEKVPGVTTILNAGVPKPQLVGWAARTTAEFVIDRIVRRGDPHGAPTFIADDLIDELRAMNAAATKPRRFSGDFPRGDLAWVLAGVPYADRDAAANRGTEVHRLAELLAHGEEVDVPDELEGHVAAYVAFLDEWSPSDAIVERVVVNRRWHYMGKLDLIATVGGERVLLDVKTSRSGPYPDVALQLAGYRHAETMLTVDGLAEEPMPEVDWAGVVWVRADGYDVYRFDTSDRTFRAFLYAKQVGDWIAWADPRDRDAESPVKSDALPAPKGSTS